MPNFQLYRTTGVLTPSQTGAQKRGSRILAENDSEVSTGECSIPFDLRYWPSYKYNIAASLARSPDMYLDAAQGGSWGTGVPFI